MSRTRYPADVAFAIAERTGISVARQASMESDDLCKALANALFRSVVVPSHLRTAVADCIHANTRGADWSPIWTEVAADELDRLGEELRRNV